MKQLVCACITLVLLGVNAPAGNADLQTNLVRPAEARKAKKRAGQDQDKQAKGPTAKASSGSVAGGKHWRITTEGHGAIHVWVPPGYQRATAGTVVYIHGYYVNVDEAWQRHKLAQQFRASRQNALFIVPEAPKGRDDRVYWDSLSDLKKTIVRAGIRLPDGPTIALAHSGGFRTIAHWVDNRLLAQVVLLDAMYGRQQAFDEFIHSGKHADHRKMILVGADTASQSKEFADKFPYAVIRKGIPPSYDGLSPREKKSKLLYISSQYRHGQIVESGKVIPLILRVTPLRKL